MHSVRPRFVSIVVFIILMVGSANAQNSPARTVLGSVYNEAQAVRGQVAFEANCSKCHGEIEPDGPGLVGTSFIERWREDSLDDLYAFMKKRMPGDNPGQLSDGMYLDIVAHLLHENGFPQGAGELRLEDLTSILLVGKDGPKPLPNLTLVKVVGCMTPGANNTWTLTNATAATRTRTPEESTPDELKASADKPLGAQTLRLQNLDVFRPGFSPDSFKGRKVQVKGVLSRQPELDRLNVTSLEPLAPNCNP